MRLPRPTRRTLGRAVLVPALALLFALSLPGVQAARADDKDLAPSADELFGLDAPPAAPAPVGKSAVCGAAASGASFDRQAAYARLIAQLQQGLESGEGRVLNGRGYNYPSGVSQARALERVHREAERQRQAR